MGEIIHEALLLYNFPLTLLFGVCVAYWASVCFGLLDVSSLDADVDLHVDAGADLHLDADAHADLDGHLDADAHGHEVGGGAMISFLRFMNVHEVPLMVVVSVQVLSMWTIALFTNHHWNAGESFPLAMGFLAGNIFVSMIITRIVTSPLRPVMRALKKEWDDVGDIIGFTGVVMTGEVSEDFGQVEVVRKGAPTMCHARIPEGGEPLSRGDTALIIDYDEQTQTCIVKRLEGDKLEI